MIEFLLIYSTLQCFSRHHQVECTLFFFSFGFFSSCSLMHACYPSIPPFSWWSIWSFLFFVSMSVFILSCIIIWLQCKALFKFLSSSTRTSIDFSLFVIIEFVSRHISLFFDIPLSSFVSLSLSLLLKEKQNQHFNYTITYYFLSVCCLWSLSLSLFIHKHICRRHARSLLFVSDLDFCMCWPCFPLSTSVCLFGFFFLYFFFFFFCVFLFFPR